MEANISISWLDIPDDIELTKEDICDLQDQALEIIFKLTKEGYTEGIFGQEYVPYLLSETSLTFRVSWALTTKVHQ